MRNEIIRYLYKYRFKSIYARMLIGYSFIFATSILIVGFFSYNNASVVIQKKTNELNKQSLNQIQQITDNSMEKINLLIMNISTHYMLKKDYNELKLDEKLFLNTSFFGQYQLEEYLDSIYIYYFKEKKLISNKVGTMDFSITEDKEWFDLYQQKAPLGTKPLYIRERNILRDNREYNVFTIIRDFPLVSYPLNGILVVNLDRSKFFSLTKNTLNNGEKLLILDEENNLLDGDVEFFNQVQSLKNFNEFFNEYNGSCKVKIGGKNIMLSYVKSKYNKWVYMKAQDVGYLTVETNRIKTITIYMVIVCLISGVIIWLGLSARFYKPIIELINKFNESEHKEGIGKKKAINEIDMIGLAVDNVIDSKTKVENLYKKSQNDIIKGLLLRLCNGDLGDEDYIKQQLENNEFILNDHDYVVGLIKIDNFKELKNLTSESILEAVKRTLKVSSENVIGFSSLLTDIEENKIICLISFNLVEENIVGIFHRMKCTLEEKYGICLTIGIGSACSYLAGINISFHEAVDALNYKVFTGKGSVIHINSFSVDVQMPKYYYPISKEMEFIDAIKLGNKEIALKIINEIHDSIPICSEMAIYMSVLLWQLMNAVFLCMNTMGIKYEEVLNMSFFETYQKYNALESRDEMLNFIKSNVLTLMEYIDIKRHSKNEVIIQGIKDYINKSCDKELTLNGVASMVYMSTSYVSMLFKDIVGESFSDYVKRIRMEKAVELLTSTQKDVSDIALNVGYDNLRSFLRAFKKYFGVTPSEYRKNDVIENFLD